MSGLYSLREANRSVKLAAVLFQLVLGYAYIFAFLMVKEYAGLTPSEVAATYAPETVEASSLTIQSRSHMEAINLADLPDQRHTVDTQLLIQDSHVHIMIYAIVAALQIPIILGLGWPAWWRDFVIVAAFGSGALDFAGQWLVKAGWSGFAWLTVVAGWAMAAVYLVVLFGTLRAVVARRA